MSMVSNFSPQHIQQGLSLSVKVCYSFSALQNCVSVLDWNSLLPVTAIILQTYRMFQETLYLSLGFSWSYGKFLAFC